MSTFGRLYRVTTFGESHGVAVGCVLEGVPSGIRLDRMHIQAQLDRRRPGQSKLTTQRSELDRLILLSGMEGDIVLGSPIAAMVYNHDMRVSDYLHPASSSSQANEGAGGVDGGGGDGPPLDKQDVSTLSMTSPSFVPRPSHADYAYLCKYGVHASSGGGRSSARETIGRVIAGAVAEQVLLLQNPKLRIVAFTSAVGAIELPESFHHQQGSKVEMLTRELVDQSPVRCPDLALAESMCHLIEATKAQGDSVGGVVTCYIYNCPVGLGEPCFDKLQASLAHAILSIPAVKAFSYGEGFRAAQMKGSEHNDAFCIADKEEGSLKPTLLLSTVTNHSGGIQGGISIGTTIIFHVAFKPPATISQAQQTVRLDGSPTELLTRGRHDPCIVPRAVPIVESMVAITLLDFVLLQQRNITY